MQMKKVKIRSSGDEAEKSLDLSHLRNPLSLLVLSRELVDFIETREMLVQ